MPVSNPAIPTQEAWQAPTLLNGWANFGFGYNPAGYWKDSFGIVHLRGTIKSGTVGSLIFTLPAGYRPANRELLATLSTDGVSYLLARLDITASGEAFHTIGGNFTFWLDSLTFRAG